MHPYVPLAEYQHQVLTGLMLGDGHLCLQKRSINASLMVFRALKDQKYLQYEADLFHNLLAPAYQNGIKYNKSQNTLTGDIKEGYTFATINAPCLTEYHSKWYRDVNSKRIKIVPTDLQLSAISIAHWIADDGNVAFNKLPYRLVLELSTHGFTETEVRFLCELLSKRYHEEFLPRAKNRKGKRWWIIKAYDSACRALFLDIDPHFKMDRKRIWDKPESRFWNEPPERQIHRMRITTARRELLTQIIAKGEPITMKELAMQFKCIHNGGIEYRAINDLLQPYLDSGEVIKDIDNHNNNTTTIRIIKT